MILQVESLLDEFNSKLEALKEKHSELEERAIELFYLRKKGKMKTRNGPSVTSGRLFNCLLGVQEREEVE